MLENPSSALQIDETGKEVSYFGMVTEEEIRQQAIMYEPSTSGLQQDVFDSVTSIEPEPEKNDSKNLRIGSPILVRWKEEQL